MPEEVAAPLLDTHAWLWWVGRDPRLSPTTLESLDTLPADHRPYLSPISLWEAAMLVETGRIRVPGPLHVWLTQAAHPRVVQLLEISPAIAAETASLPRSFQPDPADRIIVATCRVHDLPLLTQDRAITRSRLVRRWMS
jgi:PIN domain nuclease of toxin-antitoxin system